MIFSKKTYFLFISAWLLLIVFFSLFLDREIAEFFLKNVATYKHIGDIISISGESHWYFGSGLLGFLFFKYYKKNRLYSQRFLFLFYINLFSGIISLLLKWFFARMRPWGLRDGNSGYEFLAFSNWDMGLLEKMKYHLTTLVESPTVYSSFPSGHTTTLFAVITYLSILFPKYLYLWLSLGIIAASSRVLANDHFVSDLLSGAIVGTLSTLFLYSKMKDKL